jgi:hypothetical protein
MSSAAWVRLLRLVPEKDQDNLMLLTSNRTEFAIQSILRLDPDFLVIRGRLAGSQDQGRVFFIPYDQIDHVGFYRAIKEAEFQEMFTGLDAAPEPSAIEPAAADGNGKAAPQIKSAVLERFRSRSSAGIAPRGPASSASLPVGESNAE